MLLLCWTAAFVLAATPQDQPLRVTPKGDGTLVEISAFLPKGEAERLPAGKLSQDQGEEWLVLCVVIDGKDGPAMLGSYHREGQKLVFVPRVPLQPEKTYRAYLFLAGKKVEATAYTVPARPAAPAAEVVAVWPAAEVLPANQLRFYLQFSRPMRGGTDIFEQIYLLDADGKVIADPWLPDELWSEDGTLLTLYIHPGRIKWGVLLRLLLGPVLEPDRRYTLVVGSEMLDADGHNLAKEYRKKFRTTAEDRNRLELAAWKLEAPEAGKRSPLTLAFPKALDHRGLARYLTVVDSHGKEVAGKVEVGQDGRTWRFVPETAWSKQEYSINVGRQLEDVAGNNPVAPFDVDANTPAPPPQRLALPFRPRQ